MCPFFHELDPILGERSSVRPKVTSDNMLGEGEEIHLSDSSDDNSENNGGNLIDHEEQDGVQDEQDGVQDEQDGVQDDRDEDSNADSDAVSSVSNDDDDDNVVGTVSRNKSRNKSAPSTSTKSARSTSPKPPSTKSPSTVSSKRQKMSIAVQRRGTEGNNAAARSDEWKEVIGQAKVRAADAAVDHARLEREKWEYDRGFEREKWEFEKEQREFEKEQRTASLKMLLQLERMQKYREMKSLGFSDAVIGAMVEDLKPLIEAMKENNNDE
jgi:hypothetical protein